MTERSLWQLCSCAGGTVASGRLLSRQVAIIQGGSDGVRTRVGYEKQLQRRTDLGKLSAVLNIKYSQI